MSDHEVEIGSGSGFSGNVEGDYNPSDGLSGSAEVCYTNSDNTTTTCVHGSSDNGGTFGLSVNIRF